LLQSQPSAPPRLEFEAAVVKPIGPGTLALPNLVCKGTDGVLSLIQNGPAPPDSAVPQGRCVGRAFLRELIALTYDVRADRVSGDPPAMYELEAKAEDPDTATKDQLLQMLQNFVIDQFKLKVHRETEEGEGYVLQAGKHGSKLKEASGEEEPPRMSRRTVPLDQPVPEIVQAKCSLKTFAKYLSRFLGGKTVIDKTDMSGNYDINLTLNRLPSVAGPRGGGANGYDPSVADAVEDQLGLRLESRKVPVENLVVDYIEKPPVN
jgi:uncharacterized protein (TIGR03435 family)